MDQNLANDFRQEEQSHSAATFILQPAQKPTSSNHSPLSRTRYVYILSAVARIYGALEIDGFGRVPFNCRGVSKLPGRVRSR